ncbi:MAG: hypothetical protein WCK27_26950 [Verrucomicrobiota bacterium]
MQTTRTNILLALTAAAALLLPLPSHGQLGGLGKAAGITTGTVTAESLMSDLCGGLDYFAKANTNFAAALLSKEEVAKINAELAALKPKEDPTAAQAFNKETCAKIKAAAEAMISSGQALSETQKQQVKAGQGEAAKGVAKWGLVGASLAMAAKSGNSDAQLATAIPAAQQMIKDLPDIKSMLGTINQLNKIK